VRSTLDPTLDLVFKKLFAHPQNRAALISLLTAVLRPSQPITDVYVEDPEVRPEQVGDKNIYLDILVRLRDGSRFNVEMQAEKRPAFRERSLFYWAKVYGSQLERSMTISGSATPSRSTWSSCPNVKALGKEKRIW